MQGSIRRQVGGLDVTEMTYYPQGTVLSHVCTVSLFSLFCNKTTESELISPSLFSWISGRGFFVSKVD